MRLWKARGANGDKTFRSGPYRLVWIGPVSNKSSESDLWKIEGPSQKHPDRIVFYTRISVKIYDATYKEYYTRVLSQANAALDRYLRE